MHVFEVDHPATQAWKRRRLARGSVIAVPPSLTFAPVDFEREDLPRACSPMASSRARPSFFTWLGVVPYLTERRCSPRSAMIGGLPGGAEVVFDYFGPAPHPDAGAARGARGPRRPGGGARRAVPRAISSPAGLHDRLRALGFGEIEDLNLPRLAARFGFAGGRDLPERGGHVLRARTRSAAAADPSSEGEGWAPLRSNGRIGVFALTEAPRRFNQVSERLRAGPLRVQRRSPHPPIRLQRTGPPSLPGKDPETNAQPPIAARTARTPSAALDAVGRAALGEVGLAARALAAHGRTAARARSAALNRPVRSGR